VIFASLLVVRVMKLPYWIASAAGREGDLEME
jgi:hypothetical protein